MKRLTWKLGAFLADHGSSAYQLESKLRYLVAHEAEQAKASSQSKGGAGTLEPGPQVPFSPNTIYAWAKSSSVPERLQTATFERILRALELIAGREVELSEILAWEDVLESVQADTRSKAQTKTVPSKNKTRGRG
jgi:hypothetical protein